MRPEKGLPKFQETKYPHRRSEGQSKRWNRGLRELEEIRVKYEEGVVPSGYPVCVKYAKRSPRNQQPCCTCALDKGEPCCKCGRHLAPTPPGGIQSDR